MKLCPTKAHFPRQQRRPGDTKECVLYKAAYVEAKTKPKPSVMLEVGTYLPPGGCGELGLEGSWECSLSADDGLLIDLDSWFMREFQFVKIHQAA